MLPHPSPALLDAITATQQRGAQIKNSRMEIDESNTIRLLVDPIIQALGWDLLDIGQVRSEYRHKPSDNPVDYALFIQGQPVLYIEAKALGKNLDDRKWISQTINYANTANVDWTILTNGEEWRIYKTHAPMEADEKMLYRSQVFASDCATVSQELAPLQRENFNTQNALAALWERAMVDSKIRTVLDSMHTQDTLVRAFSRLTQLSQADVRRGLERLIVAERAVYSPPLFPILSPQPATSIQPSTESEPTTSEKPAPAPWVGIKMGDLIEAGILHPGQSLFIKGHPHTPATIVDGKHCQYNGALMTYSAWGKAVTTWVAIQIFAHTITQDGTLLQDLRLALFEQQTKGAHTHT